MKLLKVKPLFLTIDKVIAINSKCYAQFLESDLKNKKQLELAFRKGAEWSQEYTTMRIIERLETLLQDKVITAQDSNDTIETQEFINLLKRKIYET